MTYNKLIRDKIPEMIEQNGGTAVIRQLSQEEFVRFLEMKLDEEAGEYHRDKTPEELADILEVVFALAEAKGCSREELMENQREILLAYYMENLTIPQIAENRGVNKSTVSRTLHRAEGKLRRYLRY